MAIADAEGRATAAGTTIAVAPAAAAVIAAVVTKNEVGSVQWKRAVEWRICCTLLTAHMQL